jgi:hypothetical protein
MRALGSTEGSKRGLHICQHAPDSCVGSCQTLRPQNQSMIFTSQSAQSACSPRSCARSAASTSTVAQASGGTPVGLALRSVAAPGAIQVTDSQAGERSQQLPCTQTIVALSKFLRHLDQTACACHMLGSC